MILKMLNSNAQMEVKSKTCSCFTTTGLIYEMRSPDGTGAGNDFL